MAGDAEDRNARDQGAALDDHGQERPLSAPRRVVALTLFGLAVLVLVVSGTVGTSAPDVHDRSVAAVAGLLAFLSVLVAVRDTTSSRILGIAFTVVVVVGSLGAFVPGFRLVWSARSSEGLALLVVLAAVALGLLAPSLGGAGEEFELRGSSEPTRHEEAGRPRMSMESRALLWLATGLVCSVGAYDVGKGHGQPVLACFLAVVLVTAAWLAVTTVRRRRQRRPSA